MSTQRSHYHRRVHRSADKDTPIAEEPEDSALPGFAPCPFVMGVSPLVTLVTSAARVAELRADPFVMEAIRIIRRSAEATRGRR